MTKPDDRAYEIQRIESVINLGGQRIHIYPVIYKYSNDGWVGERVVYAIAKDEMEALAVALRILEANRNGD